MIVNASVIEGYQVNLSSMADVLKDINNEVSKLPGDKQAIMSKIICMASLAELMSADMDNLVFEEGTKVYLDISKYEPPRGTK